MLIDSAVDEVRYHRFFPLERQADTLAAMRQAIGNIAGGHTVVLSTLDGQRLAYATSADTNTSRLAAMIGSLCALGETLGKELGQQEFRDVMVQMGTGMAVIQRIHGQRLVLMVAAKAEANMGLVSSHTRFCAQSIAEQCFPARDIG